MQDFNFNVDRDNGLRPCIALAITWDGLLLAGFRKGVWTWMKEVIEGSEHNDQKWEIEQPGIVQGGINEGENHIEAMVREIIEELGKDWAAQITSVDPIFLFREESHFNVRKDGCNWKGKALYFFHIEIGIQILKTRPSSRLKLLLPIANKLGN